MKHKKENIIIFILIIATILTIVFIEVNSTEKSTQGEPLRYVPLSQEEVQKVVSTVLSTEFIRDVPEEDPVALIFYSFEGNERVQRDAFLIGENELLTEGDPSIYLWIHARYIPEFDGTNLCEIIQLASGNGDLAIDSPYGNARLLLKYSSMLKYRDCFGF